MMRKPKSEERALWHQAMRGVTRLREGDVPTEELSIPKPPISSDRPPRIPSPARGGGLGKEGGIDRRSAQRLKRGQMEIEARLDLHGMTQEEAHRALDRFIARSAAAKLRNLLVITGKSGVLRKAVPRWIEEGENRLLVLASTEAQPKDGGAGALYLLLRRQR